ncbi:hypothetical protein [Thermoleptolyngbya sichuanensis]|nr:hypothetical protein [Thermoleptolyngbya sichuanensis]
MAVGKGLGDRPPNGLQPAVRVCLPFGSPGCVQQMFVGLDI